jgi:hypothetical protein
MIPIHPFWSILIIVLYVYVIIGLVLGGSRAGD